MGIYETGKRVIEVILFVTVILAALILIGVLNKGTTIEEARTKGINKVKHHLHNPVLVEDYIESHDISRARMDALISQGKIPAYSWRDFTFIESDTDMENI